MGAKRPFKGNVKGYNAKAGLYKVVYEDGDSEELGEKEVEAIAVKKVSGKQEAGHSVKNEQKAVGVGTAVSKMFFDDSMGAKRPFKGNVKGYNAKTKLYKVVYEDGDSEDLTVKEVEAIAGKQVSGKKEAGRSVNNEQKAVGVGTAVSKMFFDNSLGAKRPFKGKVKGYNAKAKLYKVVYEDGDSEDLTEKEVETIAGKQVSGKQEAGRSVNNERKATVTTSVASSKRKSYGTADSDDDSEYMEGSEVKTKKKRESKAKATPTKVGGRRGKALILSPSGRSPRSSRKAVSYADDSDEEN